jgi:acyl dehydratase
MPDKKLSEAKKLEALKGRRLGPYLSHNPVSPTQIWQWCTAMGDNNPRYQPGEDQIAPPAMMQMWTMRDFNDCYAPGSTDAPPYQVFDDMASMGYPANVAVSYDIRFHHELRIGERAKHYTSIVNISDQKKTRLGTGYFVTENVEYFTQEEVLFADALITYFQYLPPARAAEADSPAPEGKESRSVAEEGAAVTSGGWLPDYNDIDASALTAGDQLPQLRISITHKQIVGGAIATQDFIPVHHNLPAARAAGMPDIFMNILTTSGLAARYLSDWAGKGSSLKELKFDLMSPNFPGDVMVMTGEVSAVTLGESTAQVALAFSGKNSLGLHISGTATLSVPGIISKG